MNQAVVAKTSAEPSALHSPNRVVAYELKEMLTLSKLDELQKLFASPWARSSGCDYSDEKRAAGVKTVKA